MAVGLFERGHLRDSTTAVSSDTNTNADRFNSGALLASRDIAMPVFSPSLSSCAIFSTTGNGCYFSCVLTWSFTPPFQTPCDISKMQKEHSFEKNQFETPAQFGRLYLFYPFFLLIKITANLLLFRSKKKPAQFFLASGVRSRLPLYGVHQRQLG
jgi:hypothetical protein